MNLPRPMQMQGVDDEAYLNYLYAHNPSLLQERTLNTKQYFNASMRRYNFFWNNFEPQPSSNNSNLQCDSNNFIKVPINEQDRINRGYNNYHCYGKSAIEMYDTFMKLDKEINVISGAIMYTTPEWSRYNGCTGFPFGNTMYKFGCVPREDVMNDWMDYCNFISERYNNDNNTSIFNKLSYFVIWNEVGNAGWMDYSPILPNRVDNTNPINTTQIQMWQTKYTDIFRYCDTGIRKQGRTGMLSLISTDHFWDQPKQQNGDILSIGEKVMIDGMWENIGLELDWGIAVHPYDDGNPEDNLWNSQSIYTFDTLRNVVNYQKNILINKFNVSKNNVDSMPQALLWASEQGWPINNGTILYDPTRARNICYAQNLSLSLGSQIIATTHNYFAVTPDQGLQGGDQFGLLPVQCGDVLNGCPTSTTFQAYLATNNVNWGKNNDNYCCVNWKVGCKNS